ncbi:YihY/virulence factor BrkB family protein [Pseudooceanicola sp.]|jgi:membrane protein|uniref:YihY/virulence factor BrkB family protein n=1 Tax=Pseudooceanicola sp. TaxID=1914328 RepID=UPI00405A14C3
MGRDLGADASNIQPVRPAASGASLWIAALIAVWHQVVEANMALVAAGVAFFSMLSLFPGLAAVISMWGIIANPEVVLEQIGLLETIVPDDVYRLILTQANKLMSASTDTLGWTGLISLMVATWSARSGVAALMLGLNMIHGRRRRTGLRHYLTALLLTLILFAVSIFTLAMVVVLPVVLTFIPLEFLASLTISSVRWLAAIGLMLFALALLYRYGPNTRDDRMRWVTPGAGLAVAVWGVASWAFSFYLTNFGHYNEVYGSIGAAIALLVWLFVSAFVVLLGAALNVQLDRIRRSQPASSQALP